MTQGMWEQIKEIRTLRDELNEVRKEIRHEVEKRVNNISPTELTKLINEYKGIAERRKKKIIKEVSDNMRLKNDQVFEIVIIDGHEIKMKNFGSQMDLIGYMKGLSIDDFLKIKNLYVKDRVGNILAKRTW